jgi:hypothetical protein
MLAAARQHVPARHDGVPRASRTRPRWAPSRTAISTEDRRLPLSRRVGAGRSGRGARGPRSAAAPRRRSPARSRPSGCGVPGCGVPLVQGRPRWRARPGRVARPGRLARPGRVGIGIRTRDGIAGEGRRRIGRRDGYLLRPHACLAPAFRIRTPPRGPRSPVRVTDHVRGRIWAGKGGRSWRRRSSAHRTGRGDRAPYEAVVGAAAARTPPPPRRSPHAAATTRPPCPPAASAGTTTTRRSG